MSVVSEVIYQFKSILSTVDIITDRETQTYNNTSTSYTLYNTATTSILEVRGTLSGSSHTFVDTTDYTHSTGSIVWTGSGDTPDNDTSFYVDYMWTRSLTVAEGYPCNPDNLPYVSVEVQSAVERVMNVGQFSSRGTETSWRDVLLYLTLYEGKETDIDASNHYSKKELLNWTTDAVDTKVMKNKRLGDYIVDATLMGMTGRLYDGLINSYTNQMRYTVQMIKEARY